LEAEIVLDYDDARIAKAVTGAISPDNFKTPKGLKVKTVQETGRVVSRIACEVKLATLISTIDDLLSCTSTAEKAVRTAHRLG
jgi:hypothetical protein